MATARPIVPDPETILCEGCGYTLTGLPAESRCPECGKPIRESAGESVRRPPAWEGAGVSPVTGFVRTSGGVLFRPGRFYRTLATRSDSPAAAWFSNIYWALAGVFFGTAAYLHVTQYLMVLPPTVALHWVLLPASVAGAYGLIRLTTELAARLTAWEAAYRGLRLPLAVVRRGLAYHSAHYLPVAVAAWATVLWFMRAYRELTGAPAWDERGLRMYVYLLAGEIVLGAIYLFHTYWVAMRNMMYANR